MIMYSINFGPIEQYLTSHVSLHHFKFDEEVVGLFVH